MRVHMIGNAHIDPVWLWCWQDGYQEVRATFRSALDRMNETEDFVFTSACAQYYAWIEESDPVMFEEIRRRVAENRWCLVGGMWIQPDMNVPSGESVARQLMVSQRYFYEKFGVTVRTGYNVDTFGHGATLPQLLAQGGIENYVWMRPQMQENARIPEGAMRWMGPDGSSVRAFRILDSYAAFHNMKARIDNAFGFAERLNQPVMCFYGVGNHGGGPTIENLREIGEYMRGEAREGEVGYSSPDSYFDAIGDMALPTWQGELQHHASGCYSTHAQSKKLNRQAENALARAEKFAVLANKVAGFEPNRREMRRAWENVLFNQFHDVMGGCSIRKGMEDAVISYHESLSIAAREENRALSAIAWAIDTKESAGLRVRSKEEDWYYWTMNGQGAPLVVFNPHPYETDALIHLFRPICRVTDGAGHDMPLQRVRAERTNGADKYDTIVHLDKLPPMGYRVYQLWMGEIVSAAPTDLAVSQGVLENSLIRAEFDPESGALISLKTKKDGREYLAAPVKTRLFDISQSDTWAHMIFKFDQPAGKFGKAEIRIAEEGPVRAALCVTTRYGGSSLKQTWSLGAFDDQLRVDTVLVNAEEQRMIKFCLPTAAQNGRVVSDIAYGSIERVPNGDEEPCQRFIAMTDAAGGLALFNDGRYGYSSEGGELRLTVAHSSIFADHYGQAQRDEHCEYMDMGEMKYSCVVYPFAGAADQADLCRRAENMAQEVPFIADTWHDGTLPGEQAGLCVSGIGAEVGAVKASEDGQGDIIRVRETNGQAGVAAIDFPLAGRRFEAAFTPWEIKTFYVPRDSALPVRETDFTEMK